jgi:mono/diheme cytochrome c family protein
MLRATLIPALAVFLAGTAVCHADPAMSGKAVFDKHCSHCHAPGIGHPGTMQLARTRGRDQAVLEERDNLAPDYVKYIVRNGLNAMPPFKPSNITREELEALADYLSQ